MVTVIDKVDGDMNVMELKNHGAQISTKKSALKYPDRGEEIFDLIGPDAAMQASCGEACTAEAISSHPIGGKPCLRNFSSQVPRMP